MGLTDRLANRQRRASKTLGRGKKVIATSKEFQIKLLIFKDLPSKKIYFCQFKPPANTCFRWASHFGPNIAKQAVCTKITFYESIFPPIALFVRSCFFVFAK
jgi:hypothetical protein